MSSPLFHLLRFDLEDSVPQKTTSFSIAWWNTSLSPSARPRAKLKERQAAFGIIRLMTQELGIDFIALGEVSEDDLEFFESEGLENGYNIQSGVQDAGRAKFDTCFLYRKGKVNFRGPFGVIESRGNQNLKVAQQIELELLISRDIFHLFVSHWPSRVRPNSTQRNQLGMSLRYSIKQAIDESVDKRVPYIIALGDYNDEPFDLSLSEHLMATRDKELAARKRYKHLLYNPFWKNMTDMNKSNDESQYICGSYFYKGDKITKWRTFDQIMFSHAFINTQGWHLNEEDTGVLLIPQYLELVKNANEIFDHMPVLGVVEKVI